MTAVTVSGNFAGLQLTFSVQAGTDQVNAGKKSDVVSPRL